MINLVYFLAMSTLYVLYSLKTGGKAFDTYIVYNKSQKKV